MVRIVCLGIVCVVAAVAGVWGIVVIAVVAGDTIIGNGEVGTGYHVIIIVVGH